MRVFGSDIGCKNLAYCIFDIVDGKINIQSWDLVDLRECICNKKLRHGKKCNKTATYEYVNDDGVIIKVCNSHKCSNCKRIKFKDNDDLNVYDAQIDGIDAEVINNGILISFYDFM